MFKIWIMAILSAPLSFYYQFIVDLNSNCPLNKFTLATVRKVPFLLQHNLQLCLEFCHFYWIACMQIKRWPLHHKNNWTICVLTMGRSFVGMSEAADVKNDEARFSYTSTQILLLITTSVGIKIVSLLISSSKI